MTNPALDPTAGERAREIALNPDLPHAIVDPTDPRCGRFAEPESALVLDPTDPRAGRFLS